MAALLNKEPVEVLDVGGDMLSGVSMINKYFCIRVEGRLKRKLLQQV